MVQKNKFSLGLASAAVLSSILITTSCGEVKGEMYTLTNDNNMEVILTNYGARIAAIRVPAADGTIKDVVWGYDSVEEYLKSSDAYCGPVVGRYGNRIAKGTFSIDGKAYILPQNDGENHLHGGPKGFSTVFWDGEVLDNDSVKMTYSSKDGEEGYPGNLEVSVIYTLTNNNELKISYSATTDAPTVINLTSHAYFNLHGTTKESIASHLMYINAESYTPTDKGLIPTGEIAPLEGTPLDFRTPTPIGERIDQTDFEAIAFGGGYDHNFVLNYRDTKGDGKGTVLAAVVYEPATGIEMKVYTDQPGVQFYSGNFMDGQDIDRNGDRHLFRSGFALETQNFPDAPNHDNFPNSTLYPGEIYTTSTTYQFSVRYLD